MFCGHLIGALTGLTALLIFGLQAVPADLEEITTARLGAVAFALAVTLSVMIWLGVPHAPAGATTLIVALGLLRTPSQLVILMAAVVILILQGIAINRLAGIPLPTLETRPKVALALPDDATPKYRDSAITTCIARRSKVMVATAIATTPLSELI